MALESGDNAADFWNPEFTKRRKFNSSPAIEKLAQYITMADVLSLFEHLENSPQTRCFQAKEIRNYCRDVDFDDLRVGKGPAGNSRAAWLDDRTQLGEARQHRNRLTANELYSAKGIGT
jgi:hypothetical protein